MDKTILVLSGGLDSTTLLYKLKDEGRDIKTLSFFYGQKHSKELECAKKICQKLNVENRQIDLSSISKLIDSSSLTSNMDIPEGHYKDENMKNTVVPNRNMIMASIAIGYAVNEGFDTVALGVHSGDHAIYPDCRPEFIQELKDIARIANYKSIDIYTPYLYKDKAEIIAEGIKLNVDYSLTWTCYKGLDKACGKCGSCVERVLAFSKNNYKDPVFYDKSWEETLKQVETISL